MATEAKTAQDLEQERKEAEAKQVNDSRGKNPGTRVHVGRTRGKGSYVITWEAFDESIPESLPKSMQQFMELTNVKDEASLVNLLIDGFNNANYTAASDPLAEFVNPSWPTDAQAQFRLVVRNYSRGANKSLEEAVALIKPGFDAQYQTK